MKKLPIILLIVSLMLAFSAYATLTLTDRAPEDYIYSMVKDNQNLSCSFSEDGYLFENATNLNITNATIFSDFDGSMSLEFRNDSSNTVGLNGAISSFTIWKVVNITAGRGTYSWYCNARTNNSDTLKVTGANRTIFYRPTPVVQIEWVNYTNISSITQVSFNVSATAQVYCSLHSNESGNYRPVANLLTVPTTSMNKTMNITHEFPTGNVKFAVMCAEEATSYSNLANIWGFSGNKTVTVDQTGPTIGLSLANGQLWKYSILNFTINVNDSAGLDRCMVYVNGTLNTTNTSLPVNTDWKLSLSKVDGLHSIAVRCNDTVGNVQLSNSTTVTIYTTYPTFANANVSNISASGYCDRFSLRWQSNEAVNATVNYGTTIAEGIYTYSTAFETVKTIPIMFNDTERTAHYINITACNAYGLCNSTNITLTSPTKLCTGWSEFVFLSPVMNISDQLRKSNADYIFKYNATNQSWISWTTAGAGSGQYNLAYGDVYLLYTSTDEAFWRDTSGSALGSGNYKLNLSIGHNYLGVTKDTSTFYNLSLTLNASQDRNSANLTYFSGWNNSAKRTVDYRFNWSWNNYTEMGMSKDIESIWVYSLLRVTWNGTDLSGGWS